MKPDWKDAPHWARWLVERGGRWWWSDTKPRITPTLFSCEFEVRGRLESAGKYCSQQPRIERRPNHIPDKEKSDET